MLEITSLRFHENTYRKLNICLTYGFFVMGCAYYQSFYTFITIDII